MQQESTIPASGWTSPGRLRATGTRPCLFSYLKELRNYINWRKHSELLNSPAEPGLQICQRACWTIKVKQWWSKWKFNAALPRLHNVSWPMKHFPAVHTAFCQHWCKSPGGRDPGLPFKLMPCSFNLVRTTEGEKRRRSERENKRECRKNTKCIPKFDVSMINEEQRASKAKSMFRDYIMLVSIFHWCTRLI